MKTAKTDLKTILLVDDDINDQHLIAAVFRNIGVNCPVQAVSSGSQAMRYILGEGEYADREKFGFPTFVITDLKMAEGDGFMVLEKLKSHPEWRCIPTLVFSSSEDPDDVRRSYLLGANSFHKKPQSLDGMRHQLEVFRDYWCSSKLPESDDSGNHLFTDSEGKLGERFDKGETKQRTN